MNTHGLTDFNQYCSHVININDLYLISTPQKFELHSQPVLPVSYLGCSLILLR